MQTIAARALIKRRAWPILRSVGVGAMALLLGGLFACTAKRYDPQTAAGQVACSMASERIQERCHAKHVRRGALTYGVASTVVRVYRGGQLESASAELPYHLNAPILGRMVDASILEPRFLTAYCRHEVLQRRRGRATDEDWCYCSAVCGSPDAYSARACRGDFEHYRSTVLKAMAGTDPLPTCDDPPDDRLDPNDIIDGDPPGGVTSLMME